MSRTTNKPADAIAPADQAAPPVPTHGGVYVNEGGVLTAIAGGPPAAQPPASEPDPSKEGAA